jgi:hypothetical protein
VIGYACFDAVGRKAGFIAIDVTDGRIADARLIAALRTKIKMQVLDFQRYTRGYVVLDTAA